MRYMGRPALCGSPFFVRRVMRGRGRRDVLRQPIHPAWPSPRTPCELTRAPGGLCLRGLSDWVSGLGAGGGDCMRGRLCLDEKWRLHAKMRLPGQEVATACRFGAMSVATARKRPGSRGEHFWAMVLIYVKLHALGDSCPVPGLCACTCLVLSAQHPAARWLRAVGPCPVPCSCGVSRRWGFVRLWY